MSLTVPAVSESHFSRFPMMNIYIHNISYNLSQWHNRVSSLRTRACLPDLSLFVCTIRLLERRLCTETLPLVDWFAYWQKWHILNFHSSFHISLNTPCLVWKYSFKIYWGLRLSVTMECLSISLPLSLTPARIILYSYIRLWEIPRELGIIKDGIYCFIMYIRAKAICTV